VLVFLLFALSVMRAAAAGFCGVPFLFHGHLLMGIGLGGSRLVGGVVVLDIGAVVVGGLRFDS
jgi:hypothetical protein